MAVRLAHNILVFGGKVQTKQNCTRNSNRKIWMYNLYTEQWKKHMIPDRKIAPPALSYACAVAIEQDVFMFGGRIVFGLLHQKTNKVWKLTRTSEGSFVWSNVTVKNNTKVPTP